MELTTTKNVPMVIEFNFLEIKQNLIDYSEKYKGLVVTDENLKEMVDVKNDLGKLEKEIDSYRLAQKKELEKPIKEFEGKCKELLEVLKDVSNPIRLQINAFEELRKEEKMKEVQGLIHEAVAKFQIKEKYASQLTITAKYLNKGQKVKDTVADLEQRASLLKNFQEQEEQLQKLKEERTNFIQKIVENKNAEHSLNLRFSSFLHLMEKETTEILEQIESIVQKELEKRRVLEAKIEKVEVEDVKTPVELVEVAVEKMEERNSYIFTIRDLTKEDVANIEEMLSNEFFRFECKKI